jgi:ABC-type branched-subunit amino acid transport system substrate-binding protein
VFTLQPSLGRTLRNYVHWAHERGLLTGKKIGLYYFDDAVTRDLMDRTIKTELSGLGHTLAAEQTTTQNLGGPADALAVQRFRTAGVDVAMLFTSKAGFMAQAQAQAWKPTYLENDYLSGTTNTATSTYPAEQFDGTFGMSSMRYGEWKVGLPATAEAEACLSDYERVSGKRIDPNAREAEYVGLNKGCDDARLVLQALVNAGRSLTPAGMVAQLEQLQGMPMGVHGDVTFGPDKHHGIDQQRTVQWTADCKCWKALGSFEPLYVP